MACAGTRTPNHPETIQTCVEDKRGRISPDGMHWVSLERRILRLVSAKLFHPFDKTSLTLYLIVFSILFFLLSLSATQQPGQELYVW